MPFVWPHSHAEANLMLCRQRYVTDESTEIHMSDIQKTAMFSEEELEESLALNLNFYLLEFG